MKKRCPHCGGNLTNVTSLDRRRRLQDIRHTFDETLGSIAELGGSLLAVGQDPSDKEIAEIEKFVHAFAAAFGSVIEKWGRYLNRMIAKS